MQDRSAGGLTVGMEAYGHFVMIDTGLQLTPLGICTDHV